MKDQHKMIKGYRDLSQEEIDLMNEIKQKGNELGELVDKIQAMQDITIAIDSVSIPLNDQRWVAIAKTHLQQGIMALTRAVAKPESF